VPVVRSPIFEKHEREGLDPPDIYPDPDDVIINEATGEVTIDGPKTKEEAGARKAVRQQALESMRRYFEVEAALAKKPTNRALRREFKELKKYQDFLKKDSERNARREALRQARRALEAKPPEPNKRRRGSKKDG
jgi:phytoene dehydrogenase-like protein